MEGDYIMIFFSPIHGQLLAPLELQTGPWTVLTAFLSNKHSPDENKGLISKTLNRLGEWWNYSLYLLGERWFEWASV